jgi:hypothetical protein
MNKEFILYEQALALKELGFDEPCFGFYNHQGILILMNQEDELNIQVYKNSYVKLGKQYSAPLYQQAFRWFRKNFGLFSSEVYDRGLNNGKLPIIHSYSFRILNLNNFKDFYGDTFKTYEEAELECLKKLIEIVKKK